MFSKFSMHHGHGQGHGHWHRNKMHRHGGRHDELEHHFRHPDRHIFKRRHHRGMRGLDCPYFSESELPDKTTQNAEAGGQDAPERDVHREFHRRWHHWKHGRCCCCEPTNPETNVESGEKIVEPGDKAGVPDTTTENTGAAEKSNEVCHCQERHLWRKHHGGHHKGKRGHGFKKPCPQCSQEESTTGNEVTTEEEGGVKQGYITKHYRGHHGDRRGDKFWKGHHGGKWGHGPHGHHHRGWRYGCCIIMVDAAVNTDDLGSMENAVQEVSNQEESNANQVMEQDVNEGVSQEEARIASEEQVLEVADNLRKSSLE